MHPGTFASLREESIRDAEQVLFRAKENSRQRVLVPPGPPQWEVLHPYLGFVVEPVENLELQKDTFAAHGFPSNSGTLTCSGADIVIGIFGGSVAEIFVGDGSDALIEELTSAPEFSGRTFCVSTVALGGYKQPQQLLALQYFQSLGARFDIVLLIDGFNDIALALAENVPSGISIAYPWRWSLRIDGALDPHFLPILGQVSYLKQKRMEWAMVFRYVPLRFSTTASAVWMAWDRILSRRIATRKIAFLAERPPGPIPFAQRGPPQPAEGTGALLQELVAIWQRSSLLMEHAVAARGGLYYHVLQPNQYVEGSKPMGKVERSTAIVRNHPYGRWVHTGYPLLQHAGEELRKGSINFLDATMVFATHEEPLYVDNVGHFNSRGNAILGHFIAKAVLKDVRTRGGWVRR